VSIVLLVVLVWASLHRARRVRKQLEDVETKVKRDG